MLGRVVVGQHAVAISDLPQQTPLAASGLMSQFTYQVLLDLGRIRTRHPYRARSGALSIPDAPRAQKRREFSGL